jgi:hypothetical protein
MVFAKLKNFFAKLNFFPPKYQKKVLAGKKST